MKKSILSLAVLLCFFVPLAGCSEATSTKRYESEDFVMSTYLKQQLYSGETEKAAEEVEGYFRALEEKLSMFSEESDITKINEAAGIKPVIVDTKTIEILSIALEFSKASDGLFDVSIAPLTMLWGIDTENATIPTKTEIDSLLSLVDYKQIKLDKEASSVMLEKKGMKLDLGGIAKGYSAHGVTEIYKSHNITGALCSIGGNIFVYGEKPDGKPFTIGIKTPEVNPTEQILGKISLKNSTISTAGGYERYLNKDGQMYHHILDTRTGYPSEADLLSVTVIAEDGGRADALSTTLFLMGSKSIAKYIDDSRFSVIVVDDKNQVYVSPAISNAFTLTNPDYSLAKQK